MKAQNQPEHKSMVCESWPTELYELISKQTNPNHFDKRTMKDWMCKHSCLAQGKLSLSLTTWMIDLDHSTQGIVQANDTSSKIISQKLLPSKSELFGAFIKTQEHHKASCTLQFFQCRYQKIIFFPNYLAFRNFNL